MKWLRKILGLDFPDPQVGQVWRCTRNGEFMRICDVHIHTSGTWFITVQNWSNGERWGSMGWGIGQAYAIGLGQWRAALRAEKREFIGIDFDPEQPIGHMPAVMEAIHKSPRFSFEGACEAVHQSANIKKEEPCS